MKDYLLKNIDLLTDYYSERIEEVLDIDTSYTVENIIRDEIKEASYEELCLAVNYISTHE